MEREVKKFITFVKLEERLSVNIDPRSAQVQNLISLIFGSSITLKGTGSRLRACASDDAIDCL